MGCRVRRLLACVALALGSFVAACGGGSTSVVALDDDASVADAGNDAETDATVPTDAPQTPDASDAAATDAGPDAIACTPLVVDAALVDGMIVGLPSSSVVVSPPVVTPQVSVTPPANHFQKQVGVLNLSPTIADAQSVVHMLAPMGMPYAITTSPVLAIQHDMAIFFPEATASSFDATALQLLTQYVQGGGVVVMKYSEVAALKTLGGVASSTFRLEHHGVDLTAAGKALFPSLDRPEEQHIPLGGDPGVYLNTWAMDLDPAATATTVIATFDDGKAAIVEHKVGAGVVYTFGVDWRDVVLRNQLGHAIDATRGYINLFEPATDAWMLMLRDLYDARVRFGVRLHTAPAGSRGSLLLSHDLDWGASYDNAIQFMRDEAALGVNATFFVHTKYVTDSQDTAFFGPERAAQLATLLAGGGSIGSHTVAHSPVLHTFPVGDGTEAYPAYAPFNVSLAQTTGATLFGELRVSKSLIDPALAGRCAPHETLTFRAGNLEYHAASPQTMERLGYRFDSTRAVGDVLSNFPFRAMTDWPDALDTSVFEFPVTLEDQLAPRLDQRVAAALAVVAANADNGAPTTLLVHPNVLDYKENALKAIVQGLPAGVKAMGVEAFGAFWRARDAATLSFINYDDSTKTLTLTLTTPLAAEGLTIRVSPQVSSVKSPAGVTLVTGTSGNFVVLPPLAAGATLTITLGYI